MTVVFQEQERDNVHTLGLSSGFFLSILLMSPRLEKRCEKKVSIIGYLYPETTQSACLVRSIEQYNE